MKDNIDDRLRMKGTQLTGPMPMLGTALDNLCMTYVQFFNSHDKVERLKLLGSLKLAAVDCQYKAKTLIEIFGGEVFSGPLPSIDKALDRRVQHAIKYSQPGLDVGEDRYLHGAYLQLTQLGKLFVGINPTGVPSKEEIGQRVQYLFQIHNICNDVAELTMITSAEPERGLAQ